MFAFSKSLRPAMRSAVAGAALVLGLTGSALAADAGAEPDPAMVAQGKIVFTQNCMSCHSLDTAKNAFGPSLVGVVGRDAGTVPRFDYSDAMQASGLVWTEDNLRKWIADNEALVPGTRMRHVSITDGATQDYLLAFLKSLEG